jgi:hypothetical protein
MHRRKLIGIAGLVALVVLALGVGTAQAYTLTVNGTKLANGEKREVAISQTGTFTLVGKLLGQKVEITWKHLKCNGTCVVTQNGSTVTMTGQVEFTESVVDEPASCGVTNFLTGILGGVIANAISKWAWRLLPAAGGETLGTLKLTGCALAGSYPLKGVLYGETSSPGIELVSQPLAFSSAINTAFGGSLKLGTEAATLTGAATGKLTAGLKWGFVE